MIKKIFLILGLFSLVITIHYCIKVYNEMYLPAEKCDFFSIQKKNDDILRIAFIGDSWAYLHSLHQCNIDSLVNKKIDKQVQVRSAGISGLTSKEIYKSIFNDSLINSLFKWGPDYCIIMAGINDTDLKLGVSYYKKNMQLIIDFLIDNDIIPIVLEIPHYDIEYSFERRYKRQKLQRLLSMILTCSGIDCIDEYRAALLEILNDNSGKIIYIEEKKWCPGGYLVSSNLYCEDMMHINEKGYQVLDTCIASHIILDVLAH